MLQLKSCPRCRGDVHTSSDIYGEYKECLQCGYMVDIPKVRPLFRHDIAEQGGQREVA